MWYLYSGARPQPRDEPFPDARLAPGHQGMGALVPAVEIADDQTFSASGAQTAK